ncbi:MAG TPA: NAD(P)H-dependent oxidoreductase [Telluria sp.]|nr:NAD(P)H-dependent oxidoreductase [Telluria sp.]
MKIVGLGGSLRVNSYSAAALRKALEIAADAGAQTDIIDLRELNLPIYIPDAPVAAYAPPVRDALEEFLAKCRSADVMLWATPTYHGSMSGAMKNAIDYMQLLARDPAPYLQGKAVGLLSISDAAPLAHLAGCVQELRAWLAPTRLTFDAEDFSDGMVLASEKALRRTTRLVDELLVHARGA